MLESRADPESARSIAEASLEALKREPNADLEIRARIILCDFHSERDQKAALAQVEAANKRLPQARRAGLRAGLLVCEGEILETQGENGKARDYYEQAVLVATTAGDDEMLAGALYSRGYLVGLQGNFAAGLNDLQRSQMLYEQVDMPQHALTALNSIATFYSRMGDFEQALPIYERALREQTKAGLKREQIVTMYNIGRTNEMLGNWEVSKRTFAASLDASRKLNYLRGEAYALRGLAAIEVDTGDAREALKMLDRAAQLHAQTPDARLGAQIQFVRGRALHKLQRLQDSAAVLESAIKIFTKADTVFELRAAHDELASVYSDMGYWRAAFENQARSQAAADKLFRSQLDQRFTTLKVEFDTAATVKENALLVRQNEVNETKLAQEGRVQRLQAAVIALSILLLFVLTALALRQRRSSAKMRILAMTDELTGVPNRRAVLARVTMLLEDHQAPPCAMLAIDIDHFKSINDQHGHPQGDEALKRVAETIAGDIREPAFIGRLGGEEFLVVMPSATREAARALAERLRERVIAIDSARWTGAKPMTVSIGATLSVPGRDTTSSMLQRADSALYAAKHAGRNCVCFDTDESPARPVLAAVHISKG
jgi:diguanylate cyclase (GGDEF)-like protein